MAANDALSFYVKFYEDSQHNINGLIRQLQGKLENLTIHLKAENINISGLEKALSNIKPVQVVDKTDLNGVVNRIGDIKKLLSDAFSTSEKGAKFPGVLESLDNIRKEIANVISAMNELKTTISSLGGSLSTGVSNAIVANMNDIAAATTKAAQAIEGLNTATNSAKGGDPNSAKNVAAASKEYEGLAKQLKDVDKELERAKRLNIDTSDIEKTINKLLEAQKIFKQIADPNFQGKKQLVSDVLTDNNVRGLQTKLRSDVQALKNEVDAVFQRNVADNLMNSLRTKLNDLGQITKDAGRNGLVDLGREAKAAETALTEAYNKLRALRDSGASSKEISIVKSEMTTALKQYEHARKELANFKAQAERSVVKNNVRQADAEIQRLRGYLRELKKLQSEELSKATNKDAFKNSAGYKEIENAIKKLEEYINKLKEAKSAGQSIGGIDLGSFKAGEAAATMARLTQSQRDAVISANELAQAQQRMGQAMQSAIDKASLQSQVLSDLKSMATQYLSIWGASNFVKEVAQITGELELQQKSLEVIIGSAGKAQELFNDIKGMSQMSPYTFQNLLKTTRQLAAFGIETKDLYGTMKQLSDIGAGLDVDVQRLVLAYGHIKSSGVLTGIQRRQLETAGIGITAELAKLYNDQYRASGSSERVSAEDVFKRIRDRQVTFEDVEKVFNRLTGPGGKFENMQLKQYETLGGKLRNLQNNYNIMLDEIGKAHMGLLMGGVNTLNSLMENWQKWAEVIKAVGAGLIAVKVAQIGLGKSFAAHRAATLSQAALVREQQWLAAANASKSGRLGMFWGARPSPQLGMPYAEQINSSALSRYQKINAALHRNVQENAMRSILTTQGLNKAYQDQVVKLQQMANSDKMATAMRGRFLLMQERVNVSLQAFTSNLKAGFAALISSPMTWIFAAVAGITALVQKSNAVKEQSENIRKSFQKLDEDGKELERTIKDVGDSIGYVRGKNKEGEMVSFLDRSKLLAEDPKDVIERLDQELQKFDPLYKGHLVDINALQDDADKVLAMMNILDNQRRVNEKLASQAGAFAAANESTGYQGSFMDMWGLGHWLIGEGQWDTFLEEAKEIEAEYTKIIANIDSHRDVLNEKLENAIRERGQLSEQERLTNPSPIDNIAVTAEKASVDYATALKTMIASGENFLFFIDETEDAYGNTVKAFEINTSRLTSSMNGLKSKMGPIVSQIASGLKDFEEIDKDGSLRVAYLAKALDQLLNAEGNEITDPASRDAIKQILLDAVEESMTAGLPPEKAKEWRDNIFTQLLAGDANVEASNFIDEMVRNGLINGGEDISPETVEKLREKFNEVINKATAGKNEKTAERIRNAYKEAFEKAVAGIRGADLKTWQRTIKNALSLVRFEDLETRIGVKVSPQTNLAEFAEEVRKKYKEMKGKAENLARTINIGAKLKIKFDVDALMGNTQALKELYARVFKYYLSQRVKLFDETARKNAEEAKEFLDALKPLLDVSNIEKATGYDLHTDEKSDKEAEKRRRDAEKAREKAEREREKAAEEARRKEEKHYENLISMIAELRREHKRLRDDGFNKEGAMLGTKDYYDRMFKGKGIIEWEKLNTEDITSVSPYMENIGKMIDASKLLDQEAKERLKRRALEQLMQAENVGFRERSDEILNEFNKELEAISVGFETLRKILSATGDEILAGDVSGYGLGAAAGKMSSMIEEYLDMALGLKLGGKYKEIDYGEVAKLDEKGIEEYVKGLYGDKETAYIVKAVSQALKEYRKAIKNENKDALEAYTKAISSAMDYGSQIARIEQEANDAILKIRESGLPVQQQQRAIDIVTANRDMKLLEASNQYRRFFNGIFSEPRKEMEEMSRTIADTLLRQLRSGAISADEYAKKIEEVNKVMREFDQKDSDAWWNKGFFDNRTMEQRIEDARNKGQEIYSKASDEYQQAMAKGDQKGAKDALDMMSKGQSMMKGANNAALAMAIIDKVVHGIDKSIQGTVKAFNYLRDALEALGVESDTMSTIGDYLGTIGEMSGHVTASWDAFKSGDFFGASVEAFGAITSLITGFAQAHDNRLQRKIDKIQFETEKMNNTLDTIKSLRERQLGYDNGNMRLMLAAMYTQNGNHGRSDAATQAMIDYYTRYSGGSGYEQELALLEGQRQKLLEIYNLEDEKKKSSKEDLEDYKKQIADLDEQIHFFVEDLAKELWGIDLKGWADQLGDALMTAFENGTSAASAFHDTVQDIMRNMVKSMLVTSVIEPAMKNLSEKLFGKDGNGGLLNLNDPKGSMGAVLAELGNWFNNEGPKLMDVANEFYNGADNMMRQTLGYGMRESEKSSNTVNSIQSAASEETMGIVAGYLSRISQDVSVQRIMQEMFVNGSWPSYIEQVTSANNSLTAIDRSTTAMMEMMRDGNGALYERVENMSRRLDNFANGIDRIYIN